MKNIFSKFSEFISDFFRPTPSEIHLGKSEYDKVWDKINSSYERAKKNNETTDFYLGRGDYLHYDREWNCHTPSVSFFSLKVYSEKYGNEMMLNSFKNDLMEILKEELTPSEFNCLKTYIWIYILEYYEEKSFEIEWRVEKNMRELIKKHIDRFSCELSDVLEDKWPSDGFIFKNILSSIKNTKNRFGIDLLDITSSDEKRE